MRGDILDKDWLGLNFLWISGSTMWPSEDELDSPFDIFSCMNCGWEFKHATSGWMINTFDMAGSFDNGAMEPAKKSAELHWQSRCEYITYPPKGVPIILHGTIE